MSSLHFLYVNSKLGRQHTRRRWQLLSVHLICELTVCVMNEMITDVEADHTTGDRWWSGRGLNPGLPLSRPVLFQLS